MNKIIIDGKEYELSDDLAEKIKAEVALQEIARQVSENPFERKRADYYYIESAGNVCGTYDAGYNESDNSRFLTGNYCRDLGLMEQRALHETLNRLLWRYSEEHGGDLPWIGSALNNHWRIHYVYPDGKISAFYNDCHKQFGCVYFRDEETARAAIEEVVKPFIAAHPEFVW